MKRREVYGWWRDNMGTRVRLCYLGNTAVNWRGQENQVIARPPARDRRIPLNTISRPCKACPANVRASARDMSTRSALKLRAATSAVTKSIRLICRALFLIAREPNGPRKIRRNLYKANNHVHWLRTLNRRFTNMYTCIWEILHCTQKLSYCKTNYYYLFALESNDFLAKMEIPATLVENDAGINIRY